MTSLAVMHFPGVPDENSVEQSNELYGLEIERLIRTTFKRHHIAILNNRYCAARMAFNQSINQSNIHPNTTAILAAFFKNARLDSNKIFNK